MPATGAAPSGPCIIKLGGSLHDAPELAAWLAAIAIAPGPPRIVVPGGGPFADAVRMVQGRLGFHDLAAHRMAILAMQQYGLLLQALEPRLGLAETEAELREAQAAIWLPWALAGPEEEIEPSWEVTSDSLALWLAQRLQAPLLLLVKSVELPAVQVSAARLAAAGVIDPVFPRLLPGFGGTVRLLPRPAAAELSAALGGAELGCLLSAGRHASREQHEPWRGR
jgi:aspartokinase-like uncharacterized kinase